MRHSVWLMALAAAGVAAAISPVSAQSSKKQDAKPESRDSSSTKSQGSQAKSNTASTAPAPAAAAGNTQPSLLGQFGDWGAYTANPGGRKICFVLAKPNKAATEPANRPRDPAYMFISTRPAEKVANEVSVIVGYGMKPNQDAVVDVGGAKFAMYTQNDGAWIKNAAEEPRLIEALRKSGDVTVRGESAKGTKTTDIYSLKGLAQALDRVGQECK